jgi:hypothetical protein
MNQIIKTKIDGVPVEIEISKMGPATVPEIKTLESNISKEDTSYVPTTTKEVQNVRILKIGEDGKASPEDVARVKKTLEGSEKNPAALVQDLVNSIENVPNGKDWWASKVVWLNVISIITAILTHFGITSFQLDPQLFDTVFPVIIAVINLWLRKGTSGPLSDNVIPRFSAKK